MYQWQRDGGPTLPRRLEDRQYLLPRFLVLLQTLALLLIFVHSDASDSVIRDVVRVIDGQIGRVARGAHRHGRLLRPQRRRAGDRTSTRWRERQQPARGRRRRGRECRRIGGHERLGALTRARRGWG